MAWTRCDNCSINVNLVGRLKNCPRCGLSLVIKDTAPIISDSPMDAVGEPKVEKLKIQKNSQDPDQPTFQQMQRLIDEVREIKELVKVLRWVIPSGVLLIMIYLKWLGVKVNLSPTMFVPFVG